VRDLIRELSVMFGDMDAIDELRRIAADRSAELNTRRRALQTLAQTRVTPLIPLLTNLLSELEIAPDAIRALATTGDDSTPSILLSRYAGLRSRQAKVEVVAALASRPAYADELVSAVRQGVIPPQDVGKFHVRQMRSFKGRELARQLEALWPASRPISAEKKTQMEHYERMLAPENLSGANLGRGRQLYGQACAGCHVLFGEGSRIGPELTGSDRRNLAYLLENILDPSNVVAENYRLSVLTLKDGRIVNGVVGAKTPRTVEVQTPTEKLVIENENIESITASKLSMMPEGLLEAFTPEQARELVSYLMAPEPSAP
jgi:putative heme-binding domain-containing protein